MVFGSLKRSHQTFRKIVHDLLHIFIGQVRDQLRVVIICEIRIEVDLFFSQIYNHILARTRKFGAAWVFDINIDPVCFVNKFIPAFFRYISETAKAGKITSECGIWKKNSLTFFPVLGNRRCADDRQMPTDEELRAG